MAFLALNLLQTAQAADALERMQMARLAAVHDAVQQLQLDRQPVQLASRYEDVRALLHVHSRLSHDSIGTPDEIRQAAIEAGVRVILFTEHPADHYDYFRDGNRGLEDGVLFVPGAEEKGLLAFPLDSVARLPEQTPQQKVDAVRATGGQVFLSHLEERMDWELDDLIGTEIYNIHADFKDEPALLRAFTSPATLMATVVPAMQTYPQEAFAALQDYPADYLRRWDELNARHHLTGIAANDAHQNTGLRIVVGNDGRLIVQDGSGDPVTTIDLVDVPLLRPLVAGRKPGDVIFQLQLDPYVRSFRHVSTHLLLDEFSEAGVRRALEAGRAYVAFDWICDPTGFVFQATRDDMVSEMGSAVSGGESELVLRAEAPLEGTFKLIRNGREFLHLRGRSLEAEVTEPGIYRVEVWLNVAEEPQIWILSNPIYVD